MPNFRFSKTNKSVESTSFPTEGVTLTLESRTGSISIPTHAFLPIPKGALPVNFALGLYENGNRIPAQVEVIQTWDATNGPPKWLHIHFIAVYSSGTPRTYVVKQETYPDTPPTTNLEYTEDASTITVENGLIKIEVSKDSFCGIRKMWYDPTGLGSYGSPILDSTDGGPIYLGEYKEWLPKHDANTLVEIEQSGPVKITIKASGELNDAIANTNQHMRQLNRITMYHDTTWVIFHQSYHPKTRFKNMTFGANRAEGSGRKKKIHGFKYSLPFQDVAEYAVGVDETTISNTLPSYAPDTPATDLLLDLVGYWKLNESSGYRRDSVGEQHFFAQNVTSTTGVIGNATSITNNVSTSYLTNKGQDDTCVDVGGTNSYSISVWVKFDTLNTSPFIISRWSSNQNEYSEPGRCFALAYFNFFTLYCYNTAGVSTTVQATNFGAATTGVWYHIVATFNGSNNQMSIKVNNGTANTATLPGTHAHATVHMVMGALSNSGVPVGANVTYGLNGDVCMLGFWKRVLSNSDITNLYNSGSGLDYPFGLTPVDPVPNPTVAYLHQYDFNQARLIGAAEDDDPGDLEKSDGWASLTTSNDVRISFFTRNLWEKYPKEIEMSENGLVYHIWPQHGEDVDFDLAYKLSPHQFHKFLNYHSGKAFDPQLPIEYLAMMQVGPGWVCTIDNSTNLVTTAYPHEWATGQKIQFMRGNDQAVLPTSTPQITANEYIYNNVGSYYVASNDVNYRYINVQSSTTFYVYDTLANANAGGVTGRVDFTSNGTGPIFVGTTEFQGETTVSEAYPISIYSSYGMSGVRTSNEFAIVLSDANDAFDNTLHQDFFENIPLATPNATWRSYPNALGDVAAKGNNFAATETALEKSIIGYAGFERTEDYGQYNFGDAHGSTWYTDLNRAALHRCWLNSHYYIIECLWGMYYHNPTSTMLNLARVFSDHYMNVDTIRYRDPDGSNHAFGYNHGKGVTQWAGSVGQWGHWGDSDGALYGWLIDANFMCKDAYDDFCFANYAGNFFALNMEDNYGSWREFATPLKRLCSMYDHTHDARLLPPMHITGKAAIAVNMTDAVHTGTMFHPFWPISYMELTRDPEYSGVDGIARYVTGTHTQFFGDTNTSLGISAAGCTMTSIAAKAYQETGDENYLIDHMYWIDHYPKLIVNLPDDPYDGFGVGAGPLGNAHIWLSWPYFLKKLNAAGITTMPALPAPGLDNDCHGAYLAGASGSMGSSNALKIYVKKTSSNEPWAITVRSGAIGTGDLHSQTIEIKDPSNNTVFSLGDGNTYWVPAIGSGADKALLINPTTNIHVIEGTATYWDDTQFVKLFEHPSLASTLPVSTPQVEWYSNYHVRFMTSNTTTIQPDGSGSNNDTYITSQASGVNFGSSNQLLVGHSTEEDGKDTLHYDWRSLIKFDLTSLSGKTITSATLTLTPISGGQAQTLVLSRCTQANWTETGATWETYNGTNTWSSNGGDTSTPTTSIAYSGTGAATFDITALVTDALTNRSGIFNYILDGTTDGGYVFGTFASFEHVTASYRPKITATYATSNALADSPIQLFSTAADAYNNVNPIVFSTAGENLRIAPKGDLIDSHLALAAYKAVFDVFPGGPAGIYTVLMTGFEIGVSQPITEYPECSVIKNGNILTQSQRECRGYLIPLVSYPLNITVTSREQGTPTKVIIKDADGDIIASESLITGINASVTAVMNNNDGHPTPWHIDIVSQIQFYFSVTPVGGGTVDPELLLYGTNIDDMMDIKTTLGI